jgi:hypothetical protein
MKGLKPYGTNSSKLYDNSLSQVEAKSLVREILATVNDNKQRLIKEYIEEALLYKGYASIDWLLDLLIENKGKTLEGYDVGYGILGLFCFNYNDGPHYRKVVEKVLMVTRIQPIEEAQIISREALKQSMRDHNYLRKCLYIAIDRINMIAVKYIIKFAKEKQGLWALCEPSQNLGSHGESPLSFANELYEYYYKTNQRQCFSALEEIIILLERVSIKYSNSDIGKPTKRKRSVEQVSVNPEDEQKSTKKHTFEENVEAYKGRVTRSSLLVSGEERIVPGTCRTS